MAPTPINRYALLADENEWPSLQPPCQPDERLNQGRVTADDNDWENVKSRATRVTKAKTLVIKTDTQPPANHARNGRIVNSGKVQGSQPIGRTKPPSSECNHEKKINDQSENWCGVCRIKLADKTAVQAHVKQFPKHENYCNLCKRVFKDRVALQAHLSHSSGHDIFCNACLSAFVDRNGLHNHLETNFTEGHNHICLVCLLAFRTKPERDHHLKSSPMHVYCSTCDLKFDDQDERDDHWAKTTEHKHCLQPGCMFDGPDSAALERHIKQDHHQCQACKIICTSRQKLNAHESSCPLIFRPSDSTESQTIPSTQMEPEVKVLLECWACGLTIKSHSSLINHLESGRCTMFPNPGRLMQFLGDWWFSPLYMDISIHMQLRTRRIDVAVLREWADDGTVKPFVCRASGCEKSFNHLSSLVLHVESQACSWDVESLGLDKLARDFKKHFGFSENGFDQPSKHHVGQGRKVSVTR